jgi:hypothetical protein
MSAATIKGAAKAMTETRKLGKFPLCGPYQLNAVNVLAELSGGAEN